MTMNCSIRFNRFLSLFGIKCLCQFRFQWNFFAIKYSNCIKYSQIITLTTLQILNHLNFTKINIYSNETILIELSSWLIEIFIDFCLEDRFRCCNERNIQTARCEMWINIHSQFVCLKCNRKQYNILNEREKKLLEKLCTRTDRRIKSLFNEEMNTFAHNNKSKAKKNNFYLSRVWLY